MCIFLPIVNIFANFSLFDDLDLDGYFVRGTDLHVYTFFVINIFSFVFANFHFFGMFNLLVVFDIFTNLFLFANLNILQIANLLANILGFP
jgi:hypothetical protein